MATKSIAWNTGSGNITLTYDGQGDGPISIQSDANDIGSARNQVITVETVGGVISRGFTVSQAACPFPVGDVKNFSYTGSYQEIELPAGQYKLQCWGAQGGSNAAASSYSITAQAGGKGGYSEGIITLSTKTTVRVYVGGQGSSSAGGFNGGGSTTGSSTYNASNEQGVSRMGGGGGATDIRLSDGTLLSRMIVAGGGSGGAMAYKKVTTSTTTWTSVGTSNANSWPKTAEGYPQRWDTTDGIGPYTKGETYKHTFSNSISSLKIDYWDYDGSKGHSPRTIVATTSISNGGTWTVRTANDYTDISFTVLGSSSPGTLTVTKRTTTTTTNTYNYSQVGFVGGGATGGGYSDAYKGKQNAAGTNGSFGQGANQTVTNYRYCSGAGGGGWYGGGGGQKSDSTTSSVNQSGGGSGFVNTAASASNRPAGYTGLELDSGETRDGATSFPNTAGTDNETGHSGNGYAKITRLA